MVKPASVCVALLIIATGCSFHPQQVVLEPEGPAPSVSPKNATEGYLVVYSAWSTLGDSVTHHSRYKLRTEDGKFSKEVLNHIDRFDEGPVRLPLAPGSYQLTARAARYGMVVVPIVIQERKTTYVCLDGAPRPERLRVEGSSVVKLPNGQVVGWLATPDSFTAN